MLDLSYSTFFTLAEMTDCAIVPVMPWQGHERQLVQAGPSNSLYHSIFVRFNDRNRKLFTNIVISLFFSKVATILAAF